MARKSRKTKQKEVIEKELEKMKGFFSAEQLHERVNDLGIATIYRFLSDARNKKQVHTYSCNKRTIYSVNEQMHCHHICESCGRVKHFNLKSIDFLNDVLEDDISSVLVEVRGTCRQCGNK